MNDDEFGFLLVILATLTIAFVWLTFSTDSRIDKTENKIEALQTQVAQLTEESK